jgi:hypothetical protein
MPTSAVPRRSPSASKLMSGAEMGLIEEMAA